MHINSVCICGAGTMGRGIAQVFALAGFDTLVFEPNGSVLQLAVSEWTAAMEKAVAKGRLSPEQSLAVLHRLRTTSSVADCRADLILEAIVEKTGVKGELFNQLVAINPPTTIIATNTSSLSVTGLAEAVPHPERFAGLHFFNPATLMQLVEVVQGKQTSAAVAEVLVQLVQRLGKTPVRCTDAPGFIVNRVARPFYIEALRLAEAGILYEQIDRVLEARGFKMGPFRLMDLIGNDINYAVSCSVYEQLQRPPRLQPSYLQQEKVATGKLGKKTGAGYYRYGQP